MLLFKKFKKEQDQEECDATGAEQRTKSRVHKFHTQKTSDLRFSAENLMNGIIFC